jgi:hypothetical protein
MYCLPVEECNWLRASTQDLGHDQVASDRARADRSGARQMTGLEATTTVQRPEVIQSRQTTLDELTIRVDG